MSKPDDFHRRIPDNLVSRTIQKDIWDHIQTEFVKQHQIFIVVYMYLPWYDVSAEHLCSLTLISFYKDSAPKLLQFIFTFPQDKDFRATPL